MYCNNCGNKVNETDRFCTECGSPIQYEKSNTPLFKFSNQFITDETFEMEQEKSESTSDLLKYVAAAVISGLIAIVGMFFPFAKASAFTITYEVSFADLTIPEDGPVWESDLIIIVFFIGVSILAVLRKKFKLGLLSGIIAGGLFSYDSYSYWKRFSIKDFITPTRGVGFYCIILGLLFLCAFCILGGIAKRKQNEGDII